MAGIAGKVIQIAVGRNHSLVLTDEGEVYAFGNNVRGQLGYTENDYGEQVATPTPKLVTGIPGKATQIAAGGKHSLVLSDN